jgi:hypothetical protein
VITETINEARAEIKALQHDLEIARRQRAAQRLSQALSDFYTTSTELLIALADAVEDTRSEWQSALSKSRQHEVISLLNQIKRMTNLI